MQILWAVSKRVHALRGVESAIYAGGKNHFACVCTQNKPVDALQTGVIDDVTVAEVKPNEWFETVGVNGRDVKVKVDTGASCNVMSMNT